MMRPRYVVDAIIASLLLVAVHLDASGQFSVFDLEIPGAEEVWASLETVEKLGSKQTLTADDILQLYYAEKRIGHSVWGPSAKDSVWNPVDAVASHRYYSDSTISRRCVEYIRRNHGRFRIVQDGWKGDDNFWEPAGYWLQVARKLYPDSDQVNEIEFDLAFKDFIRRFTILEEVSGKSCRQYHKDIVESRIELYRAVYSKEEILHWPEECEQARAEFERGRKELLLKVGNAPFTKRLRDIDPTSIVVHHSLY